MNANVSGLGENEELKNSSPSAESPELPTTTEPTEAVADTQPAANGTPDAPMPSATVEQGAEQVGSEPCRSVSQGVGLASCLPKTAWPPT